MFLNLFEKYHCYFQLNLYEHDTFVQLKIRPTLFLQLQLGYNYSHYVNL